MWNRKIKSLNLLGETLEHCRTASAVVYLTLNLEIISHTLKNETENRIDEEKGIERQYLEKTGVLAEYMETRFACFP